MGKKLLALAVIGAAVYLFKSKKGAELRGKMGEQADKLKEKLEDMYASYKNGKDPKIA